MGVLYTLLYDNTRVGLSALLVSTDRANARASTRGTGEDWLHAFILCIPTYILTADIGVRWLFTFAATMGNNIINQSVFGNYSQKENQVTCALLKIFEADEEEFLLQTLLQEIGGISLPEKTIKLETQVQNPNGGSVPDGKLSCRYAFDIYIESKLKANIDRNQLNEHLKLLQPGKNVILLYITGHTKRPKVLPIEVLWVNWTQIYEIINGVHKEGVSPVLDYLIEQFYLLLRSLNLYDDSENRVLIVGGRWGEPVALQYGFYACQVDRNFKKSKYLAFYYQNRIQHLFEIEVERDNADLYDLETEGLVPEEYLKVKEPNYNHDLRTFFKLKPIPEFSSVIKNDSLSKNGKPTAFVQFQTYTTLEKIMQAKVTSELK